MYIVLLNFCTIGLCVCVSVAGMAESLQKQPLCCVTLAVKTGCGFTPWPSCQLASIDICVYIAFYIRDTTACTLAKPHLELLQTN